jgi:hypothetical protein
LDSKGNPVEFGNHGGLDRGSWSVPEGQNVFLTWRAMFRPGLAPAVPAGVILHGLVQRCGQLGVGG